MSDGRDIMKAEPGAVNLGECLVEGSAEDKKRGRKIKRRAHAISVALESLGLTALVIAPMLAKPAELVVTTAMPIRPFSSRPAPRRAATPDPGRATHPCVVCTNLPVAPITRTFTRVAATNTGDPDPLPFAAGTTDSGNELLKMFDPRKQPKRPDDASHEVRRIHESSIDPAMLMRRVEPIYPALARQARKSGRVDLRALVATDGTIQSLEVVGGDPLFVRSALDAVGQWRYKPTLLNGQPVEIDTFITVIYTLNQQ
jgi:periplasmic protein TonB